MGQAPKNVLFLRYFERDSRSQSYFFTSRQRVSPYLIGHIAGINPAGLKKVLRSKVSALLKLSRKQEPAAALP